MKARGCGTKAFRHAGSLLYRGRWILLIPAALYGVYVLAQAAPATTVAQAVTPLNSTGFRSAETSLGCLVADAVRTAGKGEIGFVPASVLNETNIAAGSVSDDALTAALAFPDDPVVVLSLKGSQIRKALERALELAPKGNSAFLQVSGISVKYDFKAPVGSRVKEILVDSAALETGRSYQVAMPFSLARGALGYFRIWSKDDILRNTNQKMGDSVIDYARNQGKLIYHPEDRIGVE